MKEETKLKLVDWYDELGESFWNSVGFNKIIQFISKEYSVYPCYPEPKNIFNAFYATPFKDIKGIFLGQDVYPGGEGTGICFGIDENKTRYVPPSLNKIYKAIEKECYNGMLIEFDYSMEKYAKMGLLMLNSCLTIRKGLPGSHNYIWFDFMKILLTAITCKKEGLLIFLIGRSAQDLQQYISKESNHKIYLLEHPAYSARQNRDWDSKGVFKETSSVIKW